MDPIARIAAARRFVVAGNLCTDLVIRGVPALPAWGQEVAGDGQGLALAGQGANLARGLARLGAPVLAVGAVGDDAFGRGLADRFPAAHDVYLPVTAGLGWGTGSILGGVARAATAHLDTTYLASRTVHAAVRYGLGSLVESS